MISKRNLAIGVSAIALAAVAASGASASYLMPHPRGPLAHVGPMLPPYHSPITSGTWTDLVNQFPGIDGPDTSLLLTDGTVIMHDYCTSQWYKLTPDNKGNYVKGTWAKIAAMPSGYFPFFFATQVLPDGRMIMNGGEYNGSNGACGGGVWTNKGALYDPVADSWTSVSPPTSWGRIGDAQSAILANGTYMLANCCSAQEALASISGTTVTWTNTGTGKADINDEEGWTILPGGNLLTVDANKGLGQTFSLSEIYDASAGTWSFAGNTASDLVDTGSHELGPAVLRPDGTVIYFGGTTNNNVYTVSTNTWAKAPAFPVSGDDVADGPAALLPDGNVIVQASPGVFNSPSHFFEWDGTNLTQVNDTTSAPTISSFEGRFLELPSGQVLWSNDGQSGNPEVAVYTPKGKAQKAWEPKITSAPTTLKRGKANYKIAGKHFNGFSQGATYGDDAQESTNYPIVMITNTSSGDVCFGRSHGFSTMGVQNTGKMNAKFDVPAGCKKGAGTLQVVVNGIASSPFAVTVN